jgi:hypothetical protein
VAAFPPEAEGIRDGSGSLSGVLATQVETTARNTSNAAFMSPDADGIDTGSATAARARRASMKTPDPWTALRTSAEVIGRSVGMALSSTALAA